MIRRDATSADGQPQWILISQVEHARLAGRLAENWGAGPFSPPEPRDDVLAAVFHHDDGWAAWESSPGVDPASGRPLDFTEMAAAEAVAIWRESIEISARISPLTATLVADHFSALAQRAANWKADAESAALVKHFVDAQQELQRRRCDQWRSDRSPEEAKRVAESGLAQLQFFDIVSLWFCCAERTDAITFDSPGGPPFTLSPHRSEEVEISPWPLTVSELNLDVPGRQIPVAHYSDQKALISAGRDTSLHWRLVGRVSA